MRRKSSVKRFNKGDEDTPMQEESRESVHLYNKDKSEEAAVFEDFKIIKLIGRGTFGKVYLVQSEKN